MGMKAFFALVVAAATGSAWGQELLLADTTRTPHVMVMWETAGGERIKLEGDREFRSPGDKTLLGKNIECYAALGGTRMEKGNGDPHGALLRVGLYKKDTGKLFFEDIKEGSSVTIRLEHVWMNQPVEPHAKTGLMHERYMLSDLQSCGLDGNSRNLVVTADPDDPLKKIVKEGSGRFGALDGGPGHGSVIAAVQPDGSVTVEYTIPYPLLRHLKDPNLREKPGTFFEPQHFHVEVEVVAKPAAESKG